MKMLIRHLPEQEEEAIEDARHSYYFVLQPDFCLLSLSAAIETLRAMKQVLPAQAIRWTLCAAGIEPMRSSAGIVLPVDRDLPEKGRNSTLVIVGGEMPTKRGAAPRNTRTEHWLRRCARRGARVAALHSGSVTLARAGLLTNRPATVHWRYKETLAEGFPDVELRHVACVAHPDVLTSSGGTSAIDLFLRLAELDFGETVALKVAQHFNWQPINIFHKTESVRQTNHCGVRHPIVADAVAIMETHPEDPLEVRCIAERLGLSTRQVERLFHRYLGETPKRYYTSLRLERAHRLLCFSELSVTEAAIACGFGSANHFSRAFRTKFGISPHKLRCGALDMAALLEKT